MYNKLGTVPIGVKIPPIVAPYATASTKRILRTNCSLKNKATGTKRIEIVVLVKIVLPKAEVKVSA
jgi:hypothetical protein